MVERDAGLPAVSQAVRAEARALQETPLRPKPRMERRAASCVLRRDAAAPERRDAAALWPRGHRRRSRSVLRGDKMRRRPALHSPRLARGPKTKGAPRAIITTGAIKYARKWRGFSLRERGKPRARAPSQTTGAVKYARKWRGFSCANEASLARVRHRKQQGRSTTPANGAGFLCANEASVLAFARPRSWLSRPTPRARPRPDA